MNVPVNLAHGQWAELKDRNTGFFAIDRRAWLEVCELGINPAVTYLLLARGTLADNRTTSWSVHATEKRTGISRPKVGTAIRAMVSAGIIRDLNNSATRPRRWLVEGHILPSTRAVASSLTESEATLLDELPKSMQDIKAAAKLTLRRLVGKGLAYSDGKDAIPVNTFDQDPDWIWLPNSLIDGAVGETPPVEVLRQSQDVANLGLLVDLYHAHSLTFDGGISTKWLTETYNRKELSFYRSWKVWQFWEGESRLDSEAPFMASFLRRNSGDLTPACAAFWASYHLLQNLGYVAFIAHLFEGATSDAEIIHPVESGVRDDVTTSEENKLYWAAQEAAVKLLPSFLRPKYFEEFVIPAKQHVPDVEVRGVARLRYRPHTSVTAQWRSQGLQWDQWRKLYENLPENTEV